VVFRGYPTVGPSLKIWTRDQNGRRNAKDGTPERFRCETIQKAMSYILQLMSAGAARRILLPFYLA